MKKSKILIMIMKEKHIFIICTLISIVTFLLYCFIFYTPEYSTDAKIFIRNIPKQDVITSYGGGSVVYSESGFSNPLFNLIQILESDSLASRLYENFKNNYPDDFSKLHIKSKRDWLKVYTKIVKADIKPSTDVLRINLKWINKQKAVPVLNYVIHEFKMLNLEIRKNVETNQRVFLDKQLLDIGNQLDTIRKHIMNYKITHKILNVDVESVELTKARIDLEKESKLLNSKIFYYKNKLSSLANQLDFKDGKTALRATSVGVDPYLITLNQNLSSAQQKYSILQSKYTDNYPDVIAAKNEIATLKRNIDKRKKESLNGIKIKRAIYDKPSEDIVIDLAKTQAEAASAKAELFGLNAGINQLINKESSLPEKIMGLEELKKQEIALANAYENIKQKQLESKIKENQIVDNIVLLNEPSSPKFIFNQLLMRFFGLIGLGIFAAFAISIIKEDIENKWANTQEIEEITGKKVLGTIPWIKSTELVEKNYAEFIQKSDSFMGISYGEIASNIIRKSYLEEAQAICFVSTASGRSKSAIIPNITATLARLNKTVMLIDTDCYKSANLLANFGLTQSKEKKDLLDIIERVNTHLRVSKNLENEYMAKLVEEATQPIIIDGDSIFSYIYVKSEINIYDYVATRGFKSIIDFLKQYYEFIIIDTPSKPLIFPEFTAISNVSDAITIVSAMQTNREGLINTIKRFENNNTKILGVIAREQNQKLEEFFIKS